MATRRADAWTEDEIIVAADIVRRHGWRDVREHDPDVLALSALLRALPEHRDQAAEDPKFRSPASVRRKMTDIRTTHPDYTGSRTRGGVTTLRVAEAFATNGDDLARIAATQRCQWERDVADAVETPDLDIPLEAHEGRTELVSHLRRERDPKLRAAKIEAVLRGHGALTCEVCDFNFGATYGDVGDGYIEVHHLVPLHASGETMTRLADLALLCSNCHRMIHRRMPWLTPEELQDVVRRAG
ncbi:hypothetical protein KILIM_134_00050 [Kineosphaera limosa NBRC 100340]|uniref:HNH nuclease domain-containing protein n=1 Tax=Kineosphaera limosa NBRC 100340 TaxID=1184609 RepID=K6WX32_9MICO|nr:HNH endonuclease [Kineosphaera limosa]GAB98356.1 hypothetical protein KILIM_134_00050 [Kineosphaera limosa NBRC 100340]